MRNLLCIQNKSGQILKALSFLQWICWEIIRSSSLFGKFCSLFIVKMAFFTNVVDLEAALSACLTVCDWEMLTDSVLIPDERMARAYARLTELTVQELEVS